MAPERGYDEDDQGDSSRSLRLVLLGSLSERYDDAHESADLPILIHEQPRTPEGDTCYTVPWSSASASLRVMKAVLDFLRANFALFVAVVFPLAGLVMAVAKLADGDREDGLRLSAATVLGVCVYALGYTLLA